jgi:hypothetical protein
MKERESIKAAKWSNTREESYKKNVMKFFLEQNQK